MLPPSIVSQGTTTSELWVVSPHHTCEHRTEVGAAGCQDHTVGFYLDIFRHNHHVTQQLLTVKTPVRGQDGS